MKLDELGLQIGSPVQIQMLDNQARRYTVQLIGFMRSQGLILSAPRTSDTDLAFVLKEGQPINIRFKTSKTAAAFRTHIIEKRLTPYPHIHVAIPDEIESVPVLNIQFIHLDMPVNYLNDDEESKATAARLTAISPDRAMITHSGRLADTGQSATITMSFPFAGENNVLVMDGEVEQVTIDEVNNSHTLTVKLANLDSSDKILLKALIYEQMLVNMKIIDTDVGASH